MVKKFIERGKQAVLNPQTTILSGASVIMVMTLVSVILGFIRDRVILAHFVPEQFSLYRAAFRIPDLFTGILTLGTLSSAFIPIFTKTHQKNEKAALLATSRLVSIGVVIYLLFLGLFFAFSSPIYKVAAAGFGEDEIVQIVKIARFVFLAQGIFVVSYSLTGVLESLRRFLIPAIAPIVYNLGIIIGVIFFSGDHGLIGAAYGVLVGAFGHLLIQLPLALKLGYRFNFDFKIDETVKKVAKLAAPRMLELSLLQGARTAELFLASFISVASYGYYSLATSVKALPVALFGLSIAKASLPALSHQVEDKEKFTRTFLSNLYQVIFLTLPLVTVFVVLRIPIVRLLFGTDIFDWPATVQTSLVLSTFAFGVPFEAAVVYLIRVFWALDDTKTPVLISILGAVVTIVTGFIFVLGLKLDTYALALSFSLGVTLQAILLFLVLSRKLNGGNFFRITPFIKSLTGAFASGSVMFFLIKIFDRAVWVKRLSFIGRFDAANLLPFESFVVDTRYTFNLLVLTIFVATVGLLVYLSMAILMRSDELVALTRLLERKKIAALPDDSESMSPPASDVGN